MRLFRLLAMATAAALCVAAGPIDEGQAAWERGDDATALMRWTDALESAQSAGDDEAQVDLLIRLAAVHRRIGNLDTATVALARARDLAQRDPLLGAHVRLASALLALERGQAGPAVKGLTAAFKAYQDADDPQGAANAALNLGNARLALGKLDEAQTALNTAHTLYTQLRDPAGQADALNNSGLVQRRLGDLRAAERTLGQAVGAYRAANHLDGEADALNNLSLVLSDLGRDEQAEQLLDDALRAAQTRKDARRQADILFNLAALAHRGGATSRAIERYLAAGQTYERLGRDRDALSVQLHLAALRQGSAQELESLVTQARATRDRRLEAHASLLAARGISEPKRSAHHADRALELARKLSLADVEWQALYLRGSRALKAGERGRGLVDLRGAVERLERRRRGLQGDDARLFAHGHREVYQALIDALLAQGDTLGAMIYAERLQLVGLDGTAPPDAESAQYKALLEREAWLEARLAAELAQQIVPTERSAALNEQLAALRVEFASTVDTLRSSYAHFDELVRVDPEDLEAVQADLDPGVTVLQPILFPDRLVLLLFSKDHLEAVTVPVEANKVRSAVDRYARLLGAGNRDLTIAKAFGDKLGAWLVAPIADRLGHTEVLVVSATGVFKKLPFGILRHDGQYLAQRVAVVGVTHVGSLRRRGATEGRFHIDPARTLFLGNPDGSLDGAEAEVQALHETFPASSTLIGAAGTRSAFVAAARGKTTLHLATHGRIDADRPERSYLVLADHEEDDGRLAYREIPGLAATLTDARLVVLSACESGLAVQGTSGEEGRPPISIHGLASQFRRAGVETLIGSLWRVDDAGTLDLMRGMYNELARGTDIARALQASQVRMIDEGTLAHPLYWGAFVVVGDWR